MICVAHHLICKDLRQGANVTVDVTVQLLGRPAGWPHQVIPLGVQADQPYEICPARGFSGLFSLQGRTLTAVPSSACPNPLPLCPAPRPDQ